MNHFRPFMIVMLVLASALGAAQLCGGAGKAPKKAPHPKKAAPKVHHSHHAGPKPNRVVHKPAHHPDHVIHKAVHHPEKRKEPTKVVKAPEKRKEPTKVVKPAIGATHRFARYNERTHEYGFDARWWYCFVVYPNTVGCYDSAPVNYDALQAPSGVPVTPPVIKFGQGLPISASGRALAARLDGMDVENHWLHGQQVSWRTGNPINDDKGPASNGCAFVAAVCARFKVAMLQPLAENLVPAVQYDWLLDDGPSNDWVRVGDVEAQLLANQGWLVVATWKTAAAGDRSLAGQTAIVRPDGQPAADIGKRGPRVTMAGVQNHNNIALKDGFPAKAWSDVAYFACRPR